jgi:hypothetical protein
MYSEMTHVLRVAQEVGCALLGRGQLMEVTFNGPAENRGRKSTGGCSLPWLFSCRVRAEVARVEERAASITWVLRQRHPSCFGCTQW